MSLNRQTQNFAPFLKLLLIDQNCPNTKSLLMQILAPDQSCWLQWINLFWKLSNQITYSGNCCPGQFFPNCRPEQFFPKLSYRITYCCTIFVLFFFANCHEWNPDSGSHFLHFVVPDTFVQLVWWNFTPHRRPYSETEKSQYSQKTSWPFKMELWFCRLEFGVKYLECGNVCRGWH